MRNYIDKMSTTTQCKFCKYNFLKFFEIKEQLMDFIIVISARYLYRLRTYKVHSVRLYSLNSDYLAEFNATLLTVIWFCNTITPRIPRC